jgi:ComF family protein
MAERLGAAGLAALFRQRCAGCARWGPEAVCARCAAAWPAAPGGPVPAGIDAVVAGAAYAGPARVAVAGLKFGGRRGLAGPLAAPLAAAPGLPDAEWLLVPVPLPRARRRRRGYNQAALLARAIARRRGHRVAEVLRREGGAEQSRLGRAARAANLAGAVSCGRRLEGRRIVLVDDVLTTGATAAACAAALRAAGAEAVVLAVATRVPAPGWRRAATGSRG